jgi:ribokinase
LVVTRGARGADLFRRDGSVHHQDAFSVEAVDTTGAGDAFIGTLAWGLADGRSIEEAIALAAANALATRALGARSSLPDRDEVELPASR